MSRSFRFGLLASVFGVAIVASAAVAQDYDSSQVAYHNSGDDEVTVYAPHRYQPDRSSIGAPIVNVALSRAVRYDDLDLRTGFGVRKLNERIRYTARVLCQQIHIRYVITEGEQDSCYRETVADAQDRADAAIDHARGD